MSGLEKARSGEVRSTLVRLGAAVLLFAAALTMTLSLTGCSLPWQHSSEEAVAQQEADEASIPLITEEPTVAQEPQVKTPSAEELRDNLDLTVSYRSSLSHGPKPAAYQKYIVLHDTEGDGSPMSVVDWWEGNGNLVAAQFVIGKDGSIVQCVPLDEIAHHAGYGDAGHNDQYGVVEDGRDDMLGTKAIGLPDYGMNAWSVGIELVHSGNAAYPEAQLEALDDLIAYIDAYYGFESAIIDHKAWRSGNSDTSSAFSTYLANYQSSRTHDGR